MTAGLSFGVAEWAVRVHERRRDTIPDAMSTLFYQHRRLGRALVRNADYFGWATTNSHGFRGPEVSIAPSGRTRIMVVGGSTTFDAHVAGDENAWPARFDHWLDELAPRFDVEVVNAGVPGYRVVDNLVRWITELYRFSPDIVVLYQTHNDLYGALQRVGAAPEESARPDEVQPVWPWSYWLRRHSLLYHKLRLRWTMRRISAAAQRRLADPLPDSVWESAIEAGARDFARDVTSFVMIAQRSGARVILPQVAHMSGAGDSTETDQAVRAVWGRDGSGVPLEIVLAGYRRFSAVLDSVAVQLGATYISTEDFGVEGPAFFAPGNPIHFNRRGADAFAHALATAVRQAGLLEPK